MKSSAAAIMILAVFSVAVFSLYFMHRSGEHGPNCLAAVAKAQGVACPPGAEALPLLSFHLNAFKNFSTAVISALTVALAALTLVAATVLAAQLPTPRGFSIQEPADFLSPALGEKLTHWTALHEKSPTPKT